ncbi:PREDICTED: major facilitator superfamily domain-containing protein 6 [Cyphomyrmex costatus]|uniref:Major facilitator superfamily domain-containing protein 6 n=1 Tax=Cyphomyrmex costatus TaxID=456900 RepID=A0A151ILP2_9HYME|nr:PREDICTED: major facilitator superfamily domain-containing protein 6 [Cyphomyrmex costatus]XP_018407753.1 PREDICTED: major facilitator superfamily domain-containing protein 6 [Cyphomyrmex costatus]XP_018407754.1 PREDICTED: major facilitator superfamily domain-containing protein 6 [Cyphomyrmex costatus]XP_018407755.1 PREDICTED: major facilitator superfamily domain-containing protein 6 [Cyphomyrmex costatus]KYN05808.1 Major facilitator superfamily domain-containing protein 6 [Cyphomyrmex costa
MKINYTQLPIKAHYFSFMAAMGPILPFLPVYGKQLGISPLVMGSITAILPILFLIAKPAFGFIVDYFYTRRKLIFIALLATTSSCYILMYFLPALPGSLLPDHQFKNVSCASLLPCDMDYHALVMESCNTIKDTTCHWICKDANFSTRLSFYAIKEETIISPNTTCLLNINETSLCQTNITNNYNCNVTCDNFKDQCLYTSITFWGFVLLMSLGNIGFNVSNCISDAICFDVLGEGGQMGYGRQRVWGTIGFGITAFLAGYTIDLWSQGEIYKTYTPAFLLVLTFTFIDLICCRKLELPLMSGSSNILKDIWTLLKLKSIVIFLCFTILAGIFDSFIIYFLFWYLEDLAMATGYMGEIKLIEGLIVAAETLGGEIIFFSLSGKILKKFGYGYTFTFCFVCYALRLGLISLAPTPWWVLPVEFFMQGPSYALCYTTIVAYASAVSPPGTSATIQGIVAGMDDGLGFALGSLIGGILYKKLGGATTLKIFSVLSVFTAFVYFTLYTLYLKHKTLGTQNNIEWRKPDDAQRHCDVAE